MSEWVVEIENLEKRYGRYQALAGVSLKVSRGVVFGLLGPNGAGKSTLVKSLLTIVHPTKCQGTMLGAPIGHRRTLQRVGYLPEHARFPDYLTGRQIIDYSAGLSRVPRRQARQRAIELLEQVGMTEWADKKNGTYSKGMRQRIGLAQALINDPDLVFLDEPTDGVDPGGRIEIRRIIESMRDDGKTVFVNSHLLGEVEQVADEVAILTKGQVVEQGSIEALTRREKRFEIRSLGPVPPETRQGLEREGVRVQGDTILLEADDARGIQSVLDSLRSQSVTIREVRECRSSLEEVFLQVVEK
ncbi:MAG: ATP-binding cassette domain-containing protein [Verrucomicrobiales bacterium]